MFQQSLDQLGPRGLQETWVQQASKGLQELMEPWVYQVYLVMWGRRAQLEPWVRKVMQGLQALLGT